MNDKKRRRTAHSRLLRNDVSQPSFIYHELSDDDRQLAQGGVYANKDRRRFIYKTLYATLGLRGTLIYPQELVAAVRQRWPDDDGKEGQHDNQFRRGRVVTMEEILKIDWGTCHCV